jgi:hypothetical protein
MEFKPLSLNLLNQQIVSLYLVTVFVSFVVIGWLLNGYAVTQFVWVGTLAMICYIIRVGSGAIALASVWVVGLMSMAAMHQLWLHDLPRPEFRFIPMILLANWLFALGVVWLLAKVSDFLRQKYISRTWAFSALICLVVMGMVSGWQLYQETVLFFFSPS